MPSENPYQSLEHLKEMFKREKRKVENKITEDMEKIDEVIEEEEPAIDVVAEQYLGQFAEYAESSGFLELLEI